MTPAFTFKHRVRKGLIFGLGGLIGAIGLGQPAMAEELDIWQRELENLNIQSWGIENWPTQTTISMVNREMNEFRGKVVVSRYGLDDRPDGQPKAPFAGPRPGRSVFLTAWNSNTDGCYMDLVTQAAPPMQPGTQPQPYTQPLKVQVKLGDQVETLKLRRDGRVSSPVFYTYYQQNRYLPGSWYASRNQFQLSAQQASRLMAAPANQTSLIVTMANGSFSFPIEPAIIQRWQSVYSFNPNCNGEVATQPVHRRLIARKDKSFNFPPTKEFQTAEQRVTQLLRQGIPGTGAILTEANRRQRQAFQKGWMDKKHPVGRFLGAWYLNDDYLYVYPAKRKNFACVVTQKRSGELQFSVGYTFSGNELRYGEGNTTDNALYWRGKSDYLLAQDSGPGILYPMFAVQRNLDLPDRILKQFEEARCSPDLTTVNVTWPERDRPVSQVPVTFSWLNPLPQWMPLRLG